MPAGNALLITDFVSYLRYECRAEDNAITAHESSLARSVLAAGRHANHAAALHRQFSEPRHGRPDPSSPSFALPALLPVPA